MLVLHIHKGYFHWHNKACYLLPPYFEGLPCFKGLAHCSHHRVAVLVEIAKLIGVVSQMGAALVLAMLAELCRQ